MKPTTRLNPSLLVAHLLLWGLFLLPPVPYYLDRMPISAAAGAVATSWVYFGLAVYLNQLYFLPRFFFAGQRLTYLFFTLLVLLPYAWAGGWLFGQLGLEQPPLVYFITRFYTLIFAFGFMNQYVHRQQTQQRLLQLESSQSRLELERLKAQVNPHFLFNTMHNLYALTLAQSAQAPGVVLGLSELMRYLFTTSHLDNVPLRQEVTYLEQYLALERLRLSNGRAIITLAVQGPVNTVELPPMLLIPFVKNAIKHGVETDTGQVFVRISLSVQDRDVFFEVENSKPSASIPSPAAVPSTGTGLTNVRQRLSLLFPDRHRLVIDDQPATYTITLALHQCPVVA